MDKNIDRIVITGSDAKTREAAITSIVPSFLAKGYTVFTVGNSMQELERSGVTPEVLRSPEAFVTAGLELQFAREYIFTRAAATALSQKVLIICDGGAMDIAAVLGGELFEEFLSALGVTKTALRDSYDAVFCLDSAASDIWVGSPHLRTVYLEDPGSAKERLTAEICAVLGDPEPIEIERRYLISCPDMDWLRSQRGCQAVEIEQAYCEDQDGTDIRLRKRGGSGGYIYFETIKRGEGARRLEIERRIPQSEYRKLIRQADSAIRWIRKTRYCLVYNGQYLEIDVYPFWKDKAMLEVELLHEDQTVEIPPEIHVIRDVTGDPAYSNYALSQPEGAK